MSEKLVEQFLREMVPMNTGGLAYLNYKIASGELENDIDSIRRRKHRAYLDEHPESDPQIEIQKRRSDSRIQKRLAMKSAKPDDPSWIEWVADDAGVSPEYVRSFIE
jgi:hypothetical protein